MVLKKIEQKYMFVMLANRNEFPPIRPHNFYKIMSAMQKKGLINIHEHRRKKKYKLSNYGWAIALCIAKDFDSPKKFKKFAKREVEFWII